MTQHTDVVDHVQLPVLVPHNPRVSDLNPKVINPNPMVINPDPMAGVRNPRVRVINPRVRAIYHIAVRMTSLRHVMTSEYASR